MQLTHVVLVAALLQGATEQQQAKVAWVPNPRVQDGTWVSDPGNRLQPSTRDSINRIIDALERETTSEIAVVIVDSTGGLEAGEFALALHRAWGVGKASRDNGIILLWLPVTRAIYISVGYGLEGSVPDAVAGRIQDEHIVPAFRRSEFDAGMLAGVAALAGAAGKEGVPAERIADADVAADRGRRTANAHAPPLTIEQRAIREGRTRPTVSHATDYSLVIPLAGALTLFAIFIGSVLWRTRRNRPRPCPSGHGPMVKLDERSDDAALEPGERAEEKIGSVDYDVWRCPTCGAYEVARYRRIFTSATKCPLCNFQTLVTTSTTLVEPTTSAQGLALVLIDCRNCSHRAKEKRVIPRLTRSTSSGSSGFSSSGSSRSGGGGGSGSSFGGGSSGGGGAGRSY